MDPGVCDKQSGGRAVVGQRRFYYDSVSSTCKPFTWSGCGGNGNQFRNKLICENRCKGKLNMIDYINLL